MGIYKRPTVKKSSRVPYFRRFHKNVVMVVLACVSRFSEYINTNGWGILPSAAGKYIYVHLCNPLVCVDETQFEILWTEVCLDRYTDTIFVQPTSGE